MYEWIITFGPNHFAADGTSLADRFVVIEADAELEARVAAFRMFGRKWAFVYESRVAAGINKYGLTEFFV